jgi:pyruvate/2-oxoglutarate/acetoin dehydrogenase E1 component
MIAGDHVTVVGYGSQIQVLRAACDAAKKQLGVSCELIDLRTILPWDQQTIVEVFGIRRQIRTCLIVVPVGQEDGASCR